MISFVFIVLVNIRSRYQLLNPEVYRHPVKNPGPGIQSLAPAFDF